MTTATRNGNHESELPDEETPIEIPRINVLNLQIKVIGDSPLISHKWSEKAKKEMLDKQMKKAKTAKEAKDPHQDYCDSMYWLTPQPKKASAAQIASAQFGFPAVAFKAAAVGACRFVDGIRMTEARGAFHVNGEYVKLDGYPNMREDMVRIAMGTADLRYRGEFKHWAATLDISYNASALSVAQIINLFNQAGFGVGVGEWRPEKDGPFGRFHVATQSEGVAAG